MRRLLTWVVLSLLIWSIGCGTAILVGTRQPEPPLIAELHLKDCAMPCWIGITPGVTTFDEAEAKLYGTFGSEITKLPPQYGTSRWYALQLSAGRSWQITFLDATQQTLNGTVPVYSLSLSPDNP